MMQAGNRTSVNIPSGKTSYTFDEQNRLKTVTDFSNGVTNYTYDLAGNLSKTTLPNGTIETREYDLLNRRCISKIVIAVALLTVSVIP